MNHYFFHCSITLEVVYLLLFVCNSPLFDSDTIKNFKRDFLETRPYVPRPDEGNFKKLYKILSNLAFLIMRTNLVFQARWCGNHLLASTKDRLENQRQHSCRFQGPKTQAYATNHTWHHTTQRPTERLVRPLPSTLLATMSSMIQWVLLVLLLPIGDALKHSYKTKDDERSLIGPLGFPFGFLSTGYYNLTVFDFDLRMGVHEDEDEDDDDAFGNWRGLKAMDDIDGVGFVLKRFDDEADFNRYMNGLHANSTRCAFDTFLENDDVGLFGDDATDDLFGRDGDGEADDVPKDGIFLSMMDKLKWGTATPSVSYSFSKGEEGLYFLIYQICPSPIEDIHTRFELDFHFSNLDVFGNESYLGAGEMVLPHMFFYFSLLYAVCLYLWVTNIRRIQDGEPGHFAAPGEGQPVVYPIHHLMTILLSLKTCSIFFESIRYHFLRVTGRAVLWSAVYYAFAFMKGTMLFTVILLIGSGWSFVKPFLSDREKKMTCAILGLQVINNIAIIVLTQETEGEHSFDRWTAVLHMVDILCCCAVLIPIVWHVNALEKNIEQSNGDHDDVEKIEDDADIPEDEFEDVALDEAERPENGRMASKLKLFRSFYMLVIGYIYFTRIAVYLFATTLTYRHQWFRYFVLELATLVFYCKVGMQFRPMCENPYLHIRTNDSSPSNKTKRRLEMTKLGHTE